MDVAIIGAGPAGMAVAALCARANLTYKVFETNTNVASSWRRHYDRLHLHTDKNSSKLPMMAMPKDYPTYPSRNQMIRYFENYAKHFNLDIEFGVTIDEATFIKEGWRLQAGYNMYLARALVVATGNAQVPRRPSWPGQDTYHGKVFHSSQYKTGATFKGQQVVVVGMGNSGAEIALDLCEHGASATLSVRNAVNLIPRDLLGIPTVRIAQLSEVVPTTFIDLVSKPIFRFIFGDQETYGIKHPRVGALTQIERTGHIPVIDVGAVKKIRQGKIKVRPGIKQFMSTGLVFTDGSSLNCSTIILATGYSPAPNPVNGFNDHIQQPTRQLYFCGFTVSPTGVLRSIRFEAQEIVRTISCAKCEGNSIVYG